MFKRLKLHKKPKPDLRFIDPEIYRAQRQAPKRSTSIPFTRKGYDIKPNNLYSDVYSGLLQSSVKTHSTKTSFYRTRAGKPLSEPESSDRPVYVSTEKDEAFYLEGVKALPQMLVEESQKQELKEHPHIDLFDMFVAQSDNARVIVGNQLSIEDRYLGPNYLCERSLGIFSDSKMYSALIRKELSSYRVDVRHFNHPTTFVESRYEFYDRISAWILFLSDDCDEGFIDRFLDRYCDKPTLFLCPKMSRKNATERVKEFINQYGLEEEVDLCDSEIELV